MAIGAGIPAMVNGADDGGSPPVELAIELPHSPGVRINLHLTLLTNSLVLFMTSATHDSGFQAAAMGSLVFAMQDRYNPAQPLSTTLYSSPSSLDFAARMAKVLARKLQKPCYVGSSISLGGAAGGGSVEEESEAFRSVVEAVAARAR